MKNEIGKIFIDLGKLVFAGVVLAGLMKQDSSPWLLLAVGGAVTLATITIGVFVIWLGKKNEENNKKIKLWNQ